jgi:serine/threonine protein kinase
MTGLIDTTIGRYRLESLRGRGGMAQVFKAWDPNTQRYVAVKVLHQHLLEETNFKERFSREGKLIANLNHPNIVSLFDFDQVETPTGMIHYMVMPYITGPSLKDRLEALNETSERLPLTEVIHIINGIAAALDYAHAKDMVHRDIKPGNILFDDSNTPLLTDFGLARMTFGDRITQSGVTSGTPAYMSPEQGLGEPGDHRADIYSLGIILHELLTGRLPFTADSSLGLLMKHINEPLPSPRSIVPELSTAVEAVVYRATAKEPESRYQSAGEMAHELRTAIQGDEVSGNTRAISLRAKRGERTTGRRLPLLGVAGVILLLVVIAAGIVTLSSNSAPTPTPTIPPVQAMTAGPVPFSTSFEAGDEYNEGWPERDEGLFTTRITDGTYMLQSRAPAQAHTAVYSPEYYQYSALIIETNAILSEDSQSDSGYGIVFRYLDENNYYVFAINGRQQVSVWLRENGIWYELRNEPDDWTFNEAVAPAGEANALSILAVGDHISGFVNGTRVVDVFDNTIPQGGVGFYIATTVRNVDEILTHVDFENFTVTNAVPSMSG